jgi:hypothetical protein
LPTLDAIGFVGANDFRLTNASLLKNKATDGKDIGCDYAALDAMEKRVIEGRMN